MGIKYLIFGGGYLGNKFNKFLENSIISRLRIKDEASTIEEIQKYNPEFVINCAGKTGKPNVDWCEDNKAETMFANVVAPSILALACNKTGTKMVHIGSGCIYEGDNGGRGFTEEDKPNFFGSFYSRTKILSEEILKEFNVLQLRIRIPFDDEPNPKNLITKILNFNKVLVTPNSMTYVPDLLRAAKLLMEKGSVGIFNVVNKNSINYKEILDIYTNITEKNLKYEAISPADLDQMTNAKRSNCVLDTKKLEKFFPIQDVKMAIGNCIKVYAKHSEEAKL